MTFKIAQKLSEAATRASQFIANDHKFMYGYYFLETSMPRIEFITTYKQSLAKIIAGKNALCNS